MSGLTAGEAPGTVDQEIGQGLPPDGSVPQALCSVREECRGSLSTAFHRLPRKGRLRDSGCRGPRSGGHKCHRAAARLFREV